LVRLPLDHAAAGAARAETTHAEGAEGTEGTEGTEGRACRVLVADDNPDAAESLAMLLRALGNEVNVALDGVEAVQGVRDFRPHLALLDIGMPRLDGYGAAREIRRHPLGKKIRLVALTGWGQEEDRRRAREAGFDSHLVKPAELDALLRVLAEVKPESPH
jgi:CheY-like chemotaxis protein